MKAKQRKALPGGKELKINNPGNHGVHLTLEPPERTRMATKKANKAKRGGSKKKSKKRSNSGTAAKSKSTGKKSNPATKNRGKRGGSKRANTLRKLHNGLPSIGSVSLTEWGAFVLAAIATRAITSVFVNPDSWWGVGVQAGITAAAAAYAPKSIRTAVTFGCGGGAAIGAFNRATNNAVQETITGWLNRFKPAALVTAGNGTQQGMAGYRGPRRVVRTYR